MITVVGLELRVCKSLGVCATMNQNWTWNPIRYIVYESGRSMQMALQSDLFRGDPRLEAAAKDDASHIAKGATGDHVLKIQRALNLLDGTPIAEDGIFGSKTA